jgi:hypothetical protein
LTAQDYLQGRRSLMNPPAYHATRSSPPDALG